MLDNDYFKKDKKKLNQAVTYAPPNVVTLGWSSNETEKMWLLLKYQKNKPNLALSSTRINDPDNVSTVRDIALMSKYLIQNYPEFYELFKEKTFTWDRTGGEPIKQGNRNPLLYKNVGVDGVKTGYLAVEKYSLASSMKKNERRVIAVASGFDTKNHRSSQSLKLLNWGFRNTNTFEISKK